MNIIHAIMGEIIDKIMERKRINRKKLASLPFDKKLEIVKKMRDRSILLSKNKLRKPAV